MGLKKKLIRDIKTLGIETDFDLELRGYSACRWGYYAPLDRKIVLYPYLSKRLTFRRNYYDLYMSLLHETVHHLQYKDPSFTRFYGVMHDDSFWSMFNAHKALADESIFKGETIGDTRKKNAV